MQLCPGFPATIYAANLVDGDVADIHGQLVWINAMASQVLV